MLAAVVLLNEALGQLEAQPYDHAGTAKPKPYDPIVALPVPHHDRAVGAADCNR